MLDSVAKNLVRVGISPEKKRMPKHIAMTVGGLMRWAHTNRAPIGVSYRFALERINDLVRYQTVFDIPIITLYLIDSRIKDSPDFSDIMDALAAFFADLARNTDVFRSKVKISIFGKWYDLPGRVVENIKAVIDETKDYDNFFLNLCINYDGQTEIVDACKVILRKAVNEKMDPDSIDAGMIKDNLYSSYFLPPDLLVKTGTGKRLHGFLLWDSTHSIIYFSDTLFHDFKEKDLMKAIKYFQDNMSRE